MVMKIIFFTIVAFFTTSHGICQTPLSSDQSSNTKQHILILCLTTNKGGILSHCFNLYSIMEALHLNPVIIINSAAKEALHKANLINARYIQYKPIKVANKKKLTNEQACLSEHFKTFVIDVSKDYKAKLIHANLPWELPGLASIKKVFPIKIIYTIHDDNRGWQKDIALCDAIMCTSNITTDILKKNPSLLHIPIFFTPPSFDEQSYLNFTPTTNKTAFFNQFNIGLKERLVCTIPSNFYPCKNQQIAIKALDVLIHEKKLPICLMLAGYGHSKSTCELLVKKLNLANHVYFLGYVADIKSLLYHSDIIINSSEREAFSIALLEASALKKPIIAPFDTGTNALIKNNQTGLLFHSSQASELADCIAAYTQNVVLRNKMAQQCHDFMLNNFTYAHNLESTKNIHQTLKTI